MKKLFVILSFLLGMGYTPLAQAVVLVPAGSEDWAYFKGTSEASRPRAAWRAPAFDDSQWTRGTMPFYYGGSVSSGTRLSDMRNNYSSVYMRKTFFLSEASYDNLSVSAFCDDGFILWINGIEVLRYNVNSGERRYSDVSSTVVAEPQWLVYNLSASTPLLKSGEENVLAIHAFNSHKSTSTDFAMDIEVRADKVDDKTPPTVVDIFPSPESPIANPPYITITFSEAVSGVMPDSLLCNGKPAIGLQSFSPNQYLFEFEVQDINSEIIFNWSENAQIVDVSPNENQFTPPPEVWIYFLDANRPHFDVVINEFLAVNDSGIVDSFGKHSDWIELYNRGNQTVDIGGWFLTDSAKNLQRWQFPPNTLLRAGRFLLVYCDGWDGEPLVNREYHANFSLSGDGEYLALVYSDGQTVVHEFNPAFPEQQTDTSFGWGLYYTTPTPGEPNARGYLEPVQEILFSQPRGYCASPFELTLFTATQGASIYYTLDGTVPTSDSTLYSTPLPIDKITYIRAIALKEGHLPSKVVTRTWIFPEEVLGQSTTPPEGWPRSYAVNNHKMEYGMNSLFVIKNREALRQGMTNIHSISLVTDLKNLFDRGTGIYVNPGGSGEAWERPVSVELIDPQGGEEFQIESGVRIRGAASRSSDNPKHSFRLFFRSRYGGKLKFPLFEDEGASVFTKVDLRTSQNYSWARENSDYNTFIREVFSRDSQRDFGVPYTRSRYYHLYINGQYWGLYQTQERGEADFAETYLGGVEEDWDCIKTSHIGYRTEANDGTMAAFTDLWQIALKQGFAGIHSTNYYWIKGVDSEGGPIPGSPRYLDEENLIIYMLISYYTRDPDSPVSVWGGFPNNLYGLYNRSNPDGFKWLRHDAEHSMGAQRSYTAYTDPTSYGMSGYDTLQQFNPMRLHQRLMSNPDYRMRWMDMVQEHIVNTNGLLSVENCLDRWNKRQEMIDKAIVMEAARWGHGSKTRDTWLKECNYVKNNFIPQSGTNLVRFLLNRGWFTGIRSPSLEPEGYDEEGNFIITFSDIELASGVYYTLDGSDPRLPGGSINPMATRLESPSLLVPQGSTVAARIFANILSWSPITRRDFTVYGEETDLKITELMYAPQLPDWAQGAGWSRDDFAWLELQNVGDGTLELEGYKFTKGINYTFPAGRLFAGERVVLAKNIEAFSMLYETNGLFLLDGYAKDLARKGEALTLESPAGKNILTFTYSNTWYPETDLGGHSLVVLDTGAPEPLWSTSENWYASLVEGGTPGRKELSIPVIENIVLGNNKKLFFEVTQAVNFELEVSTDMQTWDLFESWSRHGNRIEVDITNFEEISLFFRIRL